MKITNHLGELKKTLKNVRAVKVKDLFSGLEFNTDNPKLLSEFYFVFEASDGYKVVFSWNEIFNSPLGDSVFFIVGKDGQTIENQEDRIAVICTTDINAGRRYVKSVSKVWVKKA